MKRKNMEGPEDDYHFFSRITWKWLKDNTTKKEFIVAFKMSMLIDDKNAIKPLNQNNTLIQLSEILGCAKSSTKRTLSKLYKLGVYAKLEGAENYYILNPYLSHSKGLKISSQDVDSLFGHSYIKKAFDGEVFEILN